MERTDRRNGNDIRVATKARHGHHQLNAQGASPHGCIRPRARIAGRRVRAAADLPGEADPTDRPVPAGRGHRHRRALRCAAARRGDQGHHRRRQPHGGRRRDRRGGSGEGRSGRLYAALRRRVRSQRLRRHRRAPATIRCANSRRSRRLPTSPLVFVVNPAVPAGSMREFIALAKREPERSTTAPPAPAASTISRSSS